MFAFSLTWNARSGICGNRQGNVGEIDRARGHWAHAHTLDLAWIDRVLIEIDAISCECYFCDNLARNVGDTIEADHK